MISLFVIRLLSNFEATTPALLSSGLASQCFDFVIFISINNLHPSFRCVGNSKQSPSSFPILASSVNKKCFVCLSVRNRILAGKDDDGLGSRSRREKIVWIDTFISVGRSDRLSSLYIAS